jgi:hypothetical protein
MSRIRSISPGFFLNDQLCALPPLTRLLFEALWCEADREGRLLDRPQRIKAVCLPYDACDINAMLNDLAAAGFIARYRAADGTNAIIIKNFVKHQRPHPREPESTIPPPPHVSCKDAYLEPREPTHAPSRDPEDPEITMSKDPEDPARPERKPTVTNLRDLWNEIAVPAGLPKWRDTGRARKEKAERRLRERPLSEWRLVIERIAASAFCRGETKRGTWKASPDWLVENEENACKVLEGKYDNRAGPRPQVTARVATAAEFARDDEEGERF